ncbi:tetratricopeptide repeat protein [Geomonas terrae]|uniref:Tetratricopeptide repeat protein n=1 Tax=Geomonas terrae TaxID=2562681 RepID=A0A4S1CA85_9BACT|nr:tetratricopeptide repeat protein [Geomonas terrae]TGU70201.1 tetratricopeptide repeat protein [Geomonas terrae]
MNTKPSYRPALHLFIIVLVGAIAYSNTFHVPFLLDDETSIINNGVIKDLGRFLGGDGYAYNPRRFIGYLSVAMNYRLGGLDVTGYHIFNLAVHALTACLVYGLAALTLQTPFFAERNAGAEETASYRFLPLFAALLFVAHPVQTQAVTYIIQRLASLATLFFVLSLLCYGKARLLQQVGARALHWKPVLLYLGALAAAGCAMKTKEIAFTLPFVVVLYEFLFFRMSATKRLLFLAPMALMVVVVPISLLGTGRPIGSLIGDVDTLTRVESGISRLDYLYTQFAVITTYLRLLFLPVHQTIDYDFPVYHSFGDAPVALSFLLLFALLVLSLYFLLRSSRGEPLLRLVSFGILWFFITLSVESSIIPIADVIFEHRVYLPSAGAFIALAALASLLLQRLPAKATGVVIGVLVLALACTTFVRNQAWASDVTLWSDAVEKAPNKARPHYNLALAFQKAHRTDEALEHALQAARLAPTMPYAYNLIGVIMEKTGRIEQAAAALSEAIRLAPQEAAPHINLGDLYRQSGLTTQALEQYQIALRLTPADADIYYKIGTIHARSNDMDKAVVFFQCAASIEPGRPEYRRDLDSARSMLEHRSATQNH